MPPMPDTPIPDDLVGAFQIEGEPVRGRVARLGASVDQILRAHAYPEPVANLLGEACALAALVGASLKFNGRLIVQAQGDGPVSFVVADYDTSGGLRGYCSFDAEKVAAASQGFARPGAHSLLGKGVFIMTIDQGPDMDRYQGVTPIEGETLALCAERYFAQSEQTPTRVLLATAEVHDSGPQRWRAGGMILQNIAGDAARGSTDEAWNTVQALFGTLGEDELVDPTISPGTLLFRLFHEDGVRVYQRHGLEARCRCSRERVETVLRMLPPEELGELKVDGRIVVTCEFCSATYGFDDDQVNALVES